MISETQKQIYNFYLRAFRVNNNKPYRIRKKFDDFEKEPDYVYLVNLENFFKKYPHLLKFDFFDAPYKIYDKERKFYDLKYYSSYKGLTSCVAYYKQLLQTKPDEQLDFIKESLKFITEFCLEKKILLSQYIYYKTIVQNDFLKHIKEHRVCWYLIFGLKYALDILHKMEADEFELYFGTDIDLSSMYDQYINSKEAKPLIGKGLKKIEEFVSKKLKRTC